MSLRYFAAEFGPNVLEKLSFSKSTTRMWLIVPAGRAARGTELWSAVPADACPSAEAVTASAARTAHATTFDLTRLTEKPPW